MYRSILVPLDGSLASEQALPYAESIARRSGAALQLVHVHQPVLQGGGTLYIGPDEMWRDEEKQYLVAVAERLTRAGMEKVSAHVLDGWPPEMLQRQALESGSDLVVMTTHGRGPVSRFWLGSVADQLVHRLPMPLLLVRTQEEGSAPAGEPVMRKMLVALDGSPMAEQILPTASALAKAMGASITLLRVVPPEVSHSAAKKREADAALADKLRSEAQFYFTRINASLRDQGIATQTRIVTHVHPAMAILEEAATGQYDLIALETHGRIGLPRLFLGSVADKVVRGATVPVLVHRCLPT